MPLKYFLVVSILIFWLIKVVRNPKFFPVIFYASNKALELEDSKAQGKQVVLVYLSDMYNMVNDRMWMGMTEFIEYQDASQENEHRNGWVHSIVMGILHNLCHC